MACMSTPTCSWNEKKAHEVGDEFSFPFASLHL